MSPYANTAKLIKWLSPIIFFGIVQTLGKEATVALSDVQQRLKTHLQYSKPVLAKRLKAIPVKFLGLWFWQQLKFESSEAESKSIDELLEKRVHQINHKDAGTITNSVDAQTPWKVFVVSEATAEVTQQHEHLNVIFVAHRCVIDEGRVAEVASLFSVQTDEKAQNDDVQLQSSKQEAMIVSGGIWEAIKKYFDAARYYATLELCKEFNEFSGLPWSGTRQVFLKY